MVDGLLGQAQLAPEEPIALIVPHAGYVYSGAVAATGFKQLEGHEYEAIVVLGTNHSADFQRIAIWPSGAFSTPLGLAPVDSALAQSILAADPQHIVADRSVQLAEHSIEVELPFLLRARASAAAASGENGLRGFVPIMIGEPSWENCQALSQALVRVLRGKKALIVASSDMSHYPSYDAALQVDAGTLQAIQSFDPQAVVENTRTWLGRGVENLVCTLCGEGPVLTAMMVAQELGANRAAVLQYANSGDIPGVGKDRVVGYGAVMFWKGETAMLNPEEQATLLRIARETLQQYLTDQTAPQYQVSEPALKQMNGAFVTLKENGELRGCIGQMRGRQELYRTVQQMAVAAATEDPRFEAVSKEDLAKLEIEISVLSPMERIQSADEIQVGRDGLYIIVGQYSGVLLPQVATEWGWDRDEFLRQVCMKAGLPPDAWQRPDATLYRFSAQVFRE
jgi:AmmeMemoRadiSam system protein B/AmmeMemoRadiSam system protein A